jgi:hypothetical protein
VRICRVCGIGIGDSLKVKNKTRAGLICKICYKEYLRAKSLESYHRGDKSKRNKEPERKVCTECSKVFYTAISKKITCSPKCALDRKYELNKLRRLEKMG